MHEGFRRHGIYSQILNKFDGVHGDVAIAYSWLHIDIFKQYDQYIFFDLGFWGRDRGYHRVAVNAWDTLSCFEDGQDYPDDRFKAFGVRVRPAREPDPSRSVMIAGMSAKSAWTHGFDAEGQWESRQLDLLKPLTNRLVYVRPKPNKKNRGLPHINDALLSCHLLVTHHSNSALDALVYGVPCHAVQGLGSWASAEALDIEHPYMPDDRERMRIFANAAYGQYSVTEMASGVAWEFLREKLRC
jgi:hypothetical protein